MHVYYSQTRSWWTKNQPVQHKPRTVYQRQQLAVGPWPGAHAAVSMGAGRSCFRHCFTPLLRGQMRLRPLRLRLLRVAVQERL